MAKELPNHAAHGIGDAGRFGLALLDPLRVHLPQPPALLRGLGEALDEVGVLGRAVQEVECFFKLLFRRDAAVEVVVHGQDRTPADELELALLLARELERLERGGVRAPHRLLRGEERRQADAEGLRAFELKPPINPHLLWTIDYGLRTNDDADIQVHGEKGAAGYGCGRV